MPSPVVEQLAEWLSRNSAEPPVIYSGAISDVVAVQERAYKIKRPIRSHYVCYDSLAARRRYCEEEVRLNARYWPSLYKGVVRVTATDHGVELSDVGPVVEYAVEMTRFHQSDLLSATPIGVGDSHFTRFGVDLAVLHAESEVIGDTDAGTVRNTVEWMTECIQSIRRAHRSAVGVDLPQLTATIATTVSELEPILESRRSAGWIREIHGDLHPGNLVFDGDKIRAFDCLEYCETLRHLDVLVDVAFVTAGIESLWGRDSALALISGWRSRLGSAYDRRVLALYRAGRRLVEAKVASLMMTAGDQSVARQVGGALRDAQAMLIGVADAPRWR